MPFNVEVIKVDVENKGKYRLAKVTHKTAEGKVDARTLPSFVYQDVFKTFSEAQPGDVFSVSAKKVLNEKDGKEYWQWVEVEPAGKADGGIVKEAVKAARSSYETPDERAKRQVYIVRQSSISNAIALAAARAPKGSEASLEEILAIADQFAGYVLSVESAEVE
jgi:hypothetical protein